MSFSIKDGSTGREAIVDSLGRLHTHATTEGELKEAVVRGKTWNIGTGQITLTTAGASALLYVKNNQSLPLIVDLYVLLVGASTGGSGLAQVEILRNPSGGTIVSSAVDADSPVNMNFGAAGDFSAIGDAFKGAEGDTATGEDDILRSQINGIGPDRLLLPIVTLMAQGSSLGVRYTPPAGNTSQVVEVVVEAYQATEG